MWKDFKKFAFKGNVIDMAVGVVVGGAFSKIVTSLVNDIITPVISLITGGANFSELLFFSTYPRVQTYPLLRLLKRQKKQVWRHSTMVALFRQ